MKVERHYLKGMYSFAYVTAENVFEYIAIRNRMRKKKNIRFSNDLLQGLVVRIGGALRAAQFSVYTKRGWK